jgi:hypothetical protein
VLSPASPSSSNDEEAKGEEHDIHNVREELAVAGQSLRNGCREVKRQKECLAMAETTLGAMDWEVADARAANVVTRIELTGELNLFASFVKLLLVLTLNLCVFQRFESS